MAPKGGQLVVWKNRGQLVVRKKNGRNGKRRQQNITKLVFWFKRVQAVTSDTAGGIGFAVTAINVTDIEEFQTFGTLYSQYKVLKVITKFFPSNIGGESMQIATPGAPPQLTGLPMLQRGNALTYTGKDAASGQDTIIGVLQRSSARLINPRRVHKRWMGRPKTGYDSWGELNSVGNVTSLDPWDDESGIRLLGENFTPIQAPGQQNFFYNITYWKVVFRSRQE